MTRLPAPAYYEPPTGNRAHRISRWVTKFGGRYAVTRCGIETGIKPGWFDRRQEVTAEPTRPVCRVCEPRRRREP